MMRRVGEPITVLVADDLPLFRGGMMALLATEPDIVVVGEAADGAEATRMAAELLPDVVLLDVKMPRLSGPEACRAIKAAVPATKILMLTSSDEEGDLVEAVKSGAAGYLLKDAELDEVVSALRVVAAGQSLISPSMAFKLLEEFKQISRPAPETPAPRLTSREMEVLRLVAQGLRNTQIGQRLFISENTVKNHVSNILEKLQLHSRTEAVMYAVRERLLDPP